MAIDRRYQATLEKLKLHSSVLAGKRSTAQTGGGSDDGASAPMNMCDPDQPTPLRHPTGFDLEAARHHAARAAPQRGVLRSERGLPGELIYLQTG
jgi:hypothetical protein